MKNPLVSFILNSGFFTQVEPEFIVKNQGYVTLVNKSRGIVVKVENESELGRTFFDRNSDTYYSGGRYDRDEFEYWILPLIRSDKAWKLYSSDEEYDIISAVDNA